MSLYDFIQLSQTEKTNLVWQGSFLSAKEDKMQTVILYRVHDFFCEVHYDKKEKRIIKLRPFRTTTLLQHFFSYQLN
jgi:hypothetical protein